MLFLFLRDYVAVFVLLLNGYVVLGLKHGGWKADGETGRALTRCLRGLDVLVLLVFWGLRFLESEFLLR